MHQALKLLKWGDTHHFDMQHVNHELNIVSLMKSNFTNSTLSQNTNRMRQFCAAYVAF